AQPAAQERGDMTRCPLLKPDLEVTAVIHLGIDDYWRGVVDGDVGTLECLWMAAFPARAVVPQPQHMKNADAPVTPFEPASPEVLPYGNDRMRGRMWGEVSHGRCRDHRRVLRSEHVSPRELESLAPI